MLIGRLEQMQRRYPSLTYYWSKHGRMLTVALIVAFVVFNLIYISDLREWVFYALGLPPLPLPPP